MARAFRGAAASYRSTSRRTCVAHGGPQRAPLFDPPAYPEPAEDLALVRSGIFETA